MSADDPLPRRRRPPLPAAPIETLRRVGPGLVAGVSDDDPSNIGVYVQAGSSQGLSCLWLFLLTAPLMTAVQEVCARIALRTGSGLGPSLCRKFPRALIGVLILLLVVGNCITLGADLRAVAAGIELTLPGRVPELALVVVVAAALLAMQLVLSYQTLVRTFKYLALALLAYVVEAVMIRPDVGTLLGATFIPQVQLSPGFATIAVAVLGTTLSPYIFFWQASLVAEERRRDPARSAGADRGTARRVLRQTRADVVLGILVAQLVMYCLVVAAAVVLHAHGKTDVQTASDAAQALAPLAGRLAALLFAVGLIGSGLVTIPVLSTSSAYAVAEFYHWPGRQGPRGRFRPAFYLVVVAAIGFGVLMNLVGLQAIQALVVSSVIEGFIAAPLLVLIALLGADPRVMGASRSGALSRTLTGIAAAVMTLAALYYVVELATGHAS